MSDDAATIYAFTLDRIRAFRIRGPLKFRRSDHQGTNFMNVRCKSRTIQF